MAAAPEPLQLLMFRHADDSRRVALRQSFVLSRAGKNTAVIPDNRIRNGRGPAAEPPVIIRRACHRRDPAFLAGTNRDGSLTLDAFPGSGIGRCHERVAGAAGPEHSRLDGVAYPRPSTDLCCRISRSRTRGGSSAFPRPSASVSTSSPKGPTDREFAGAWPMTRAKRALVAAFAIAPTTVAGLVLSCIVISLRLIRGVEQSGRSSGS
jgi:hypothetical protein